MDENKFWEIIHTFDWSQEGDDEAVMQPAVLALSQLNEADLRQFDEILTEKLYVLDTQAHAVPTGFGADHFSVDEFLYVRCCVVANGRQFYENVLHNPAQMPTNLEFEALLDLTFQASLELGLEDYIHYTRWSYETFSNSAGWKDAHFPDDLPPGHKPHHQRDE